MPYLAKLLIKCIVYIQQHEKHTAKFRDYLLFGHKREGLEYAMKHGLWGHALFLASKMDERSYSTVMLRYFADLFALFNRNMQKI